jgi:subtilase family serine protease
VQNLAVANAQCGDTSPGPDTATWDDNPFVTAVGGSVPNVSPTTGAKLGPDPLWHVGGIFSEGAWFSSIYPRSAYQDGVAGITQSPWRSVPDITMDSQQGTSQSAPMVAGVLALATQLNNGHNVGPINPTLYDVLGPQGAAAGISDVVIGNGSVIDQHAHHHHRQPQQSLR